MCSVPCLVTFKVLSLLVLGEVDMERVCSNAVVSEGFLCSVMEAMLLQTAKSLALFLLMMGILPNGMDFFPGEPDTVGGFPISKLRAAKAPVSENIDSSETEDDDDEDDDDDDNDDNDDDDDEGDDEDTESDDDGEDKGDPEDEPGANGDGGSEEDDDDGDDEDDDDDDDDNDDGGEEDEEEDEEEEIPQPPAKKRK